VPSQFVRVGKVVKPHGKSGEVIIKIEVDKTTLRGIKRLKFLFIGEEGHPCPTPYKLQQKKVKLIDASKRLYMVKLPYIESRSDAENITGMSIYVEETIISRQISKYIGKEVICRKHGPVGTVLRIEHYPAGKMLIALHKPTNHEIMIPYNFVKKIKEDCIIVELPDDFISAQMGEG